MFVYTIDIGRVVLVTYVFIHHDINCIYKWYKFAFYIMSRSHPFQLTRRGWGEFPVRVQLHFVDPRNKKVDILHHLKVSVLYNKF